MQSEPDSETDVATTDDHPGAAGRARVLVVTDGVEDGDLLEQVFRVHRPVEVDRILGLEACVEHFGGTTNGHTLRHPDLVVIDTKSPDATLTRTLKELKQGPFAAVPVVVLSDIDDEDRVADCYGAHVAAYLVKPTSPNRLRQVARDIVSSWLPRKPTNGRPAQP